MRQIMHIGSKSITEQIAIGINSRYNKSWHVRLIPQIIDVDTASRRELRLTA